MRRQRDGLGADPREAQEEGGLDPLVLEARGGVPVGPVLPELLPVIAQEGDDELARTYVLRVRDHQPLEQVVHVVHAVLVAVEEPRAQGGVRGASEEKVIIALAGGRLELPERVRIVIPRVGRIEEQESEERDFLPPPGTEIPHPIDHPLVVLLPPGRADEGVVGVELLEDGGRILVADHSRGVGGHELVAVVLEGPEGEGRRPPVDVRCVAGGVQSVEEGEYPVHGEMPAGEIVLRHDAAALAQMAHDVGSGLGGEHPSAQGFHHDDEDVGPAHQLRRLPGTEGRRPGSQDRRLVERGAVEGVEGQGVPRDGALVHVQFQQQVG